MSIFHQKSNKENDEFMVFQRSINSRQTVPIISHYYCSRNFLSAFYQCLRWKTPAETFPFYFFSEFSCVLSWVICYISKRKIPNERASYEWVVSPQSHYYADAIQKKPLHWLSFDHHQHFPWTKTFSTPTRAAKYTEGGPNGLLECCQ